MPAGEVPELVSLVNWKSVRDADNEGYHVPMDHPRHHGRVDQMTRHLMTIFPLVSDFTSTACRPA